MVLKSDSIKNIAGALLAFQLKADKINKDAENLFFKKKYASLSNIQEHIQIPLAESGIAYTQLPTGDQGLMTMLMHADSGEYIMSEFNMKPVKEDPQAKGSAMTYQRRYALVAALGLNIEDDDDGNEATRPTTQDNHDDVDDKKPWLNENTKEFDGAMKKLSAGTTTIAKIRTVMKLSKAVEAKLLAAIKK